MADITAPIVVDLGKRKKKQLKQLRSGEGPAVAEVDEAVAQIRAQLGDVVNGRTIVPVVIVYEKKRRKTGLLG